MNPLQHLIGLGNWLYLVAIINAALWVLVEGVARRYNKHITPADDSA